MSSTPTGNDLLAQIENDNPKLGIYLRRYIVPSIQSRGLAGHVLATPTDAPGPVQLQPITDMIQTNGVSQIVAGTNITVTPTSGKGVVTVATSGGGTVTSVNLTVPPWQSVSGGPITTAGVINITDNPEGANQVFAGPATGAAAQPTFRALTPADFPSGGLVTQLIAGFGISLSPPTGVGAVTVNTDTHSESLTDGNANFIFAATLSMGGDIITVVGVPN